MLLRSTAPCYGLPWVPWKLDSAVVKVFHHFWYRLIKHKTF